MLKKEFEAELHSYAAWWLKYSVDEQNGGFYGRIAYNNAPDLKADKCIILHTRILWFFSEYARFSGDEIYKNLAKRAFDYFKQHFWDKQNQGVYWMLSASGEVIEGRKHIYAQAFSIYSLASYYLLSEDDDALNYALAIFTNIESKAADQENGGYWEAFDTQWKPISDVRLSAKESNYPKTMNSHLHLLEAYTGLNSCFDGENSLVRDALVRLLETFKSKIVDAERGHVKMFLDAQWQDHSTKWSFGHDIESSWLMLKASESAHLQGSKLLGVHYCAEKLAQQCVAAGMQKGGYLGDECEKATLKFGPAAWWVQTEAMVGFVKLWRLTNNEQYLEAFGSVWSYLKKHYYDDTYGEYHWFPKYHLSPESTDYKIGEWKGPYHTGRALLELARILG